MKDVCGEMGPIHRSNFDVDELSKAKAEIQELKRQLENAR